MGRARRFEVTFDCADPKALSSFWRAVLGYVEAPPRSSHETSGFAPESSALSGDDRAECHDPDGIGPRLLFLRVPEPKTAKNRVHLDVVVEPDLPGAERMIALEAEAQRLIGLGASRVARYEPDSASGEIGFIVMRDPEGNEFCLD